jgi:glyoxylase-like metal-dependent hydrolase (beta-lactamase superfamily II)
MQIGPYDVVSIPVGELALDGGAMFGIVPRPLWERRIGVDGRHRIDMLMRSLLIRGEGRTILVDTGIGTAWSEKDADIFRIDHSRYSVEEGLRTRGVAPEQITDVILTHLHFDHAGGAVQSLPDGKQVPTFPKAAYYVQKRQLEWATQPTIKDRGSFRLRDFEPLLETKQLTTVEGEKEILPHIHVRLTQGHTTNMQHPIIADENTTLFFGADLFPTSLHLPLPWIMAYDVRPLVTVEEKQSILAEAARENWIIAFQHCPHIAAGRITETPKGYTLGDLVDL